MAINPHAYSRTFLGGAVIEAGVSVVYDGTDVREATAGTVGTILMGIAELDYAAGDMVDVVILGPAQGIAGATLTPGTHWALSPAADGRLDPATEGDVITAFFLGTTAAADGDFIDVCVVPSYYIT